MSISLNTLETFGFTVKQALQEMEEVFPPSDPGPGDSISTIMYRSGQRSVVNWLQAKLQEDTL